MFTQWYKGNTPAVSIPPWTGGPVTMKAGNTTAGAAGALVGYVNNMRYNEVSTCGTVNFQLFRDIRVPANPVTVRLLGLVSQQGVYIVLGWETVPGIPPTAEMPPFTWKLRVNGTTTYDFTNAPAAGTNAPTVSRYLSAGLGWTTGQTITFEFI